MINPDVCSCCGEIWNREKLEIVNLGKNKLRLCPECFEEYEAVLFGAFKAGYRKRVEKTISP